MSFENLNYMLENVSKKMFCKSCFIFYVMGVLKKKMELVEIKIYLFK